MIAIAQDFFYETQFEDEALGQSIASFQPPEDVTLPKPPLTPTARRPPVVSGELLCADAERHLFRKYNWLKFRRWRAHTIGRSGTHDHPTPQPTECDALGLHVEIERTRSQLVEANLRLVLALARRFAYTAPYQFDDFVSLGNEALLRSIERFDYRLGYRFSSYAYQAIRCAILAHMRSEKRKRSGGLLLAVDMAQQLECPRAGETADDLVLGEDVRRAQFLLERLDERDRQIVVARFGIPSLGGESGRDVAEPMAFRAIAQLVGLSTTRVVQRYNRAMAKMRMWASASFT